MTQITKEFKEAFKTATINGNRERAIGKINALLKDRENLIDMAEGQLEWLKEADPRKGTSANPQNVISRMEEIIRIDTQIWLLQHTADLMQQLSDIDNEE